MTVSTADVTLGQIATIEASEQIKEEVSAIKVVDAPEVSKARMLSSYRIKRLLANKGYKNFKVYGLQTTVYTESQELNRSDVERKILAWVKEQHPSDYEIEIDYSSIPNSWKIPLADDVEFEVSANVKRVAGHMNFKLQARVESKVLARLQVRAKVKLFREMPVLANPIERDERLEASDISYVRSDVTDLKDYELTDASDLVGLVSKRRVKPGSFFSKRDFELPVLIKRSSTNRIIVINGEVQMNVTGAIALKDGRKGDTIPFNNPLNQQEQLRAKVIREGVALLRLN